MENYDQSLPEKISIKDRLIMLLNKQGPYVLRFVIRLIVDIIYLFIKFIKHLWRTFLSVFKGNY